jgi:hypothetical protein
MLTRIFGAKFHPANSRSNIFAKLRCRAPGPASKALTSGTVRLSSLRPRFLDAASATSKASRVLTSLRPLKRAQFKL